MPPPDATSQGKLENAAAERAQVEQWLARERSFQVTTADGLNWIDPFTGDALAAPFGFREAALEHLLRTRPWRAGRKPLPLPALTALRWMKLLRERINDEPRLKLFDRDGRWLNPFTGDWEPTVTLAGKLTLETLQAMAQALARTLGLRQAEPMPAPELERIARAAQRGDPPKPPASATDLLRDDAPRPAPVPVARVAAVAAPPAQASSASGRLNSAAPAAREPDNEPKTDMVRARAVMDRLLRPLPTIAGFDLALEFHPHELVGGDFYDFLQLPDGRWFFILGDVSGHGPGAALVATSALKTLRYVVPAGATLTEAMTRLNDDIRADLPAGFFISAFAAILDPAEKAIDSVCAGHHPAVVVSARREAVLTRVGRRGTAVGLIEGPAFAKTLHETTFLLEPGDRFLQYTDGMFEVANAQRVEFGNLRTMGSCVANLEHAPAQLARRMVLEVKKFAGGNLPDDATIAVIGVADG